MTDEKTKLGLLEQMYNMLERGSEQLEPSDYAAMRDVLAPHSGRAGDPQLTVFHNDFARFANGDVGINTNEGMAAFERLQTDARTAYGELSGNNLVSPNNQSFANNVADFRRQEAAGTLGELNLEDNQASAPQYEVTNVEQMHALHADLVHGADKPYSVKVGDNVINVGTDPMYARHRLERHGPNAETNMHAIENSLEWAENNLGLSGDKFAKEFGNVTAAIEPLKEKLNDRGSNITTAELEQAAGKLNDVVSPTNYRITDPQTGAATKGVGTHSGQPNGQKIEEGRNRCGGESGAADGQAKCHGEHVIDQNSLLPPSADPSQNTDPLAPNSSEVEVRPPISVDPAKVGAVDFNKVMEGLKNKPGVSEALEGFPKCGASGGEHVNPADMAVARCGGGVAVEQSAGREL